MKKIIFFLWIVIYLTQHAISQQRAQFSQYMNNLYLVNPAAGGAVEYTNINMSYRAQWVSMEGAPVSYYLSGHSPVGKGSGKGRRYLTSNHTLGGVVCNDVTGPTSRLNLAGSYSYKIKVNQNTKILAGAFMGIQQYTLNREIIKFHDPGDNTAMQRVIVPDITIGILINSKLFYAGLSMSQVFQNKLNFDYNRATDRENYSKLNNHYYLTMGVKLPINDNLVIVPSMLIKYVNPSKPAIDLNTKLKYREICWVGLSYRNLDAFIGMAGVNINEIFFIGYSYDANISALNNYNSGSQEMLFGIKLKDKRKIIPPTFW